MPNECSGCGAANAEGALVCEYCKRHLATRAEPEKAKKIVKKTIRSDHGKFNLLEHSIVIGSHNKILICNNCEIKGHHNKINSCFLTTVRGDHNKVGKQCRRSSVIGNHNKCT